MIPPLIDRATALLHSNIDVDDGGLVNQKILEASAIVLKHIKLTEFPDAWADDPDASPVQYTVPWDIQAATLWVFGTLWEIREGSNPEKYREITPLSDGVKDLLRGYRDPTLA